MNDRKICRNPFPKWVKKISLKKIPCDFQFKNRTDIFALLKVHFMRSFVCNLYTIIKKKKKTHQFGGWFCGQASRGLIGLIENLKRKYIY